MTKKCFFPRIVCVFFSWKSSMIIHSFDLRVVFFFRRQKQLFHSFIRFFTEILQKWSLPRKKKTVPLGPTSVFLYVKKWQTYVKKIGFPFVKMRTFPWKIHKKCPRKPILCVKIFRKSDFSKNFTDKTFKFQFQPVKEKLPTRKKNLQSSRESAGLWVKIL